MNTIIIKLLNVNYALDNNLLNELSYHSQHQNNLIFVKFTSIYVQLMKEFSRYKWIQRNLLFVLLLSERSINVKESKLIRFDLCHTCLRARHLWLGFGLSKNCVTEFESNISQTLNFRNEVFFWHRLIMNRYSTQIKSSPNINFALKEKVSPLYKNCNI